MTYNNNYSNNNYSIKRRSQHTASLSEKIFVLISFLFYIVKCSARNETVIMTFKVSVALTCFVALISVAYFVSIGALGALSAILIAVGLLGTVAFIFSGEN